MVLYKRWLLTERGDKVADDDAIQILSIVDAGNEL